ncbi:heat shock protein HspQ, partial [archaeon]
PVTFHLMDILNTLPSGYIAIMAYRDKALGVNGTVEISQGEVSYATKNAPKVKVWIGQETLDVKGDPPSITFWQEGENALETALGQIEESFKDRPAVAGVAIHHWGSYRILKAGDPTVPVKVSGPITEPLSILGPKDGAAVPHRIEATGTAKPGGEGVKVEVSVKPEGDIWYSQGEMPISADGTWSVTCRIGQVMRHRLHGWRAVIVGYDSRCQATAEWIETAHVNTLPHGVNQPFYHVLVDVRDRPLATVAYVAQDNVCAFLPGEEEDAIAHPLLPSYFSAYQPTKGAFIAAEALEQLYPDDCFTLPASVMLHDGGSSSSGNSSGCAHADTYHAAHPAVQHEAAYARTNSWRWSGV